jgi:hypothetical protein
MSDETASQPRIKITWLIGTLAAFALFAAIGGYSARMTWDYSDYNQDRAAQRKVTLAKVREAENKLLYPVDENKKPTAEWVDQDKGVVRIPIDEAMSQEIDTLKAQPPAAGCEITAPAPAAGATNAAPVTSESNQKLLSPDQINQPVFKTRKINTKVIIRDGTDGVSTTGGPIKVDTVNTSATPALPASTNAAPTVAGPATATANPAAPAANTAPKKK